MKNLIRQIQSLMLAASALFSLQSYADVNMAGRLNDQGLTIFSALFYEPGGFAVDGLARIDGKTPLVFICGTPGKEITASGKDNAEARKNFIAGYPECFSQASDGKIKMSGKGALLVSEKNLASCNCSPEQIDGFFFGQACQNHNRFLQSDKIEKACAGFVAK